MTLGSWVFVTVVTILVISSFWDLTTQLKGIRSSLESIAYKDK